MSRRGGDVIADYLVEAGTPYAVGVCGHGNIQLMDALRLRSDRIKTLTTHHESAAGFIADVYFRMRGRPLATFTSTGPGSYNLPIALANAMADSSAFLAVTSDVPTKQFNRGAFQETFWHQQGDFTTLVRPCVKRVFQPLTAAMIPDGVRQAYATMLKGRPGPVVLDVPFDLFIEEVNEAGRSPSLWQKGLENRFGVDPQRIQQILKLLFEAKRPLILAGNGVVQSGAEEALRAFARLTGIPVANTPLAKGVIDAADGLAAGEPGRLGSYPGNQACRKCDVLLALGCRFDDRLSSSWLNGYTFNIPPARLIQVDMDMDELGRNYPAEMAVLADAATVCEQLLAAARAREVSKKDTSNWLEQIASWKKAWESVYADRLTSEAAPISSVRLVRELRRVLPAEGVLVSDVGLHHNWFAQLWEAPRPRLFQQAWGFGAMGFGVCGVIGAKLAAPETPCVAVVGDGGFLMHAHAVATAVEYGLNPIWLVWNNKGYNSIRHMQLKLFGGNEVATSFAREATGELFTPDFAALAENFGACGLKVEKPSELSEALQAALRSDRACVVEVSMERESGFLSPGTWELAPFPHPEPGFKP